MAVSPNGWSASRSLALDNRYVPGTRVRLTPGIRQGDVATIAFYFAARFHREVEPLRVGWSWGHYFRIITGGGSLSNHASGTAWDLNAPRHGYGSRNTFTAAQVRAIRRILNDLQGVVGWGGDYDRTKDEMHFEIVKGAAAVARVAGWIRRSGDPVAPTPEPPEQPEDDVSAEDVVVGMASLLNQVAARDTATGRNVGDDLNQILTVQVRTILFNLLDEVATRSTPTGRAMGDDFAALHAALAPKDDSA